VSARSGRRMRTDLAEVFRVVIEKQHPHAVRPEVAYRGPYTHAATARGVATAAVNQGERYGVPTTATPQRLVGAWENIDPAPEEATE
jgi:hypothetical protein